MPTGAEEFICLCAKYANVQVMCLCTEYVSEKWFFLLTWAMLDLFIINLAKVTLSDRTRSSGNDLIRCGSDALKKQAAGYDKLPVSPG